MMAWREHALVEIAAISLSCTVAAAGGALLSGKITLALYCGALALAGAGAGTFLWLTERQHERQMREVEAALQVIEDLRPWCERVIVTGTLITLREALGNARLQ